MIGVYYYLLSNKTLTYKSMNNNYNYKIFTSILALSLIVLCIAPTKIYAALGSDIPSLEYIMLNHKVTIKLEDIKLTELLKEINKQTGLNFAYNENDVSKYTINRVNANNETVESILNSSLKNTDLTYKITGNSISIFKAEPKPEKPQNEDKTRTLNGKVVDSEKNPLPGTMVLIKNTSMGAITDEQGNFVLDVKNGDQLEFTFLGYQPAEATVRANTANLLITLKLDVQEMDDVTVVAFGQQRKESVVSSITTVKPGDLKSSSSDLTSQFAGKISGMIGWQTGGAPGALTESEMNTKFYIRGITSFQENANIDPLILLDGVEVSKLDLARIPVEDIESFSVLKDASAAAMYGARGANGVIIVATKKGVEGQVYTSARYETVMSQPTNTVDIVDPITYMEMYNQALVTRSPSAVPKYSVEYINRTESGDYPDWLYPRNDWYDIMFNDFSINHRFNVNARGGSKTVQYYASLNYTQDNGIIKTDNLNQFDVNVRNSTTSFRANMTINLTAKSKLILNTTTNFDLYNGTRVNPNNLYFMAFSASPVDFAPIYPADEKHNWPHTRFGVPAGGYTNNPYATTQAGYSDRSRYSTINKAEFIHDLGSVVKGLEFRASVALSHNGFSSASYSVSPFLYSLESYNDETGEHILKAENPESARRTLRYDGNAQQTKQTDMTYEGRLLHVAAWGGADNTLHQTSLTGVVQAQRKIFVPPSTVYDSFEQRNMSISARATYGFKDKYYAELSVGINGSERFAKDNRYGVFPAGGIAWMVSDEEFMAPLARVISSLKLRASYGRVGNDGIISTPRFVYLPELGSQERVDPEPNTLKFAYKYITTYPNEGIQWEIAEKYNIGIDTKLFNGIIELTADVYRDYRHNILDYRTTIPATAGIREYQLDNVGRSISQGIDLEGKIQHNFGNDLWIIINGTFTYSRATFDYIEEPATKPEWQKRKGEDLSKRLGYIAEGYFRDQDEIDNSPTQFGDVMPGDIRYRDVNGDGVIGIEDAVYIGYPETPSIIYGFGGFINYKQFEFSFSFQGSGRRAFFIDPSAISPFDGNRAMLTDIYESHWSEDNVTQDAFWPRLSTFNITQHNPQEDWQQSEIEQYRSTHFMRESIFLRCTSLELAYNMPNSLLKKVGMQSTKFYIRANNPFIISKFDMWDPELGSNGFNYPIQRTLSVGVNVSF